MLVLLRTVAKVAAALLAFYALECAYIRMQSDVAPCDMSLACFVAALGFVPQAVALPCAAWLLTRLRGRLRRTQIVVMNLLTLISSYKLIPWAQSSDDRYTLTIDARMELLGRDLNNHVFVNIGFLIGCLMLSHFLLQGFRSRQPGNRPQADTGKEQVAHPEKSLS